MRERRSFKPDLQISEKIIYVHLEGETVFTIFFPLQNCALCFVSYLTSSNTTLSMMMIIVSQLLRTAVWIIIYVSSTSFLNQPFVSCALFSPFVSAVYTKPTLTQQSEASTTAVQMSTVRHESKPIPS